MHSACTCTCTRMHYAAIHVTCALVGIHANRHITAISQAAAIAVSRTQEGFKKYTKHENFIDCMLAPWRKKDLCRINTILPATFCQT